MAALWWVIVALLLGLGEIVVPALVFGTLVVAALAGALVAWIGGSFTVQALTAAVAAVVLLAAVRPLLVRRLKVQGRFQPTNAAGHVGRPARVLAEVTELGGRVKLAGEEWSARSAQRAEVFPVGSEVVVTAIDGATAVVGAPSPVPPAPKEPRR